MANVLIAYATKEGQTEKVARHIARTLDRAGHQSELVNVDHLPPRLQLDPFECVMVGAPIHAQGYPRSMLRFVRRHRAFLDRVPSAFFSVGLAVASRNSDGRGQTLPLIDKFAEETGWRPRRVELVAGALLYTRYNPLIRLIMRNIAAKEGGDTDTSRDYEYTDFAAVERFALDFANQSLPRPNTSVASAGA